MRLGIDFSTCSIMSEHHKFQSLKYFDYYNGSTYIIRSLQSRNQFIYVEPFKSAQQTRLGMKLSGRMFAYLEWGPGFDPQHRNKERKKKNVSSRVKWGFSKYSLSFLSYHHQHWFTTTTFTTLLLGSSYSNSIIHNSRRYYYYTVLCTTLLCTTYHIVVADEWP